MKEYINIVNTVLEKGEIRPNRTGTDALTYFFVPFEFDLRKGYPLLTTKKTYFKGIIGELLWFLTGTAKITGKYQDYLKFWRPWADKQGYVPSAYGNYWRYYPINKDFYNYYRKPELIDNFITKDNYGKLFFDQIAWVTDNLLCETMSRRLVVMAWEPQNAVQSILPPCHYTFYLDVTKDKELNLHWTQRSCDVALGVPFNIASYAALVEILAANCYLKPGKLTASFLNTHIYVNHIDKLKEQIEREPYTLPTIECNYVPEKYQDGLTNWFKEYPMDYLTLNNYKYYSSIEYEVAV